MVGMVQMTGIFTRKIRGTIAYFLGFFLIVINFKLIGVVLQGYAVYEFFKSVAIKLLSYLTFLPVIGGYIQRFIDGNQGYQKKNDNHCNDV